MCEVQKGKQYICLDQVSEAISSHGRKVSGVINKPTKCTYQVFCLMPFDKNTLMCHYPKQDKDISIIPEHLHVPIQSVLFLSPSNKLFSDFYQNRLVFVCSRIPNKWIVPDVFFRLFLLNIFFEIHYISICISIFFSYNLVMNWVLNEDRDR